MTEESSSKAGLVKGLGIGGLVLGILTLIVSFIPCFGMYALWIGIIAIAGSVYGFIVANKEGLSKGLLIAALICAVIGSAVAGWQYSNYLKLKSGIEDFSEEFGDEFKKAMEEAAEEMEEAND